MQSDVAAGLAYSGTQKCLACPPGLSPVTVSQRALDRHAARKIRGYRIEVGGGLGPLAGKIWRIGLMGHNASPSAVATLIGALDEILG